MILELLKTLDSKKKNKNTSHDYQKFEVKYWYNETLSSIFTIFWSSYETYEFQKSERSLIYTSVHNNAILRTFYEEAIIWVGCQGVLK